MRRAVFANALKDTKAHLISLGSFVTCRCVATTSRTRSIPFEPAVGVASQSPTNRRLDRPFEMPRSSAKTWA
jgi:hypothetical protein